MPWLCVQHRQPCIPGSNKISKITFVVMKYLSSLALKLLEEIKVTDGRQTPTLIHMFVQNFSIMKNLALSCLTQSCKKKRASTYPNIQKKCLILIC